MAATKQFLLNYDSNILLPYTTLDCILGKEDDDPDAAKTTGIDVITDNLLKNIKEFIYNTSENVLENQIKGSDISKAYVLGVSTLREGGTQVYTKFHELTLDSSTQAGQYLGADGTNHEIKFTANKDRTWYSTSIDVKPSNRLDNPIAADVSININVSNECFDIVDNNLYSKYSTRATSANVSKYADYAHKIGTVIDRSTGATDVITIGSNIALQLNNGNLTAITKIGASNQPIYIEKDGTITPCSGNFGSNTKFAYISSGSFAESDASIGSDDDRPIFLKNGVFTEFSHSVPTYKKGNSVGNENTPVFIDLSGKVKECTYSAATATNNQLIFADQGVIHEQVGAAGSPNQPVYVEKGQIVPIIDSIGDSQTPVYLDRGKITECDLKANSIKGADAENYYLMSNADGVGVWGKGNTTTAGSFENVSGTAYYIVGIDPNKNVSGDSFEQLTGAKRSDNTGIYFKNFELFQTSDENLKTFTGEIDINFDNLATIKKGIYHWTDDPNKISDIGIGARSLEALYPEIVDENNGVKTVAYNRLGVIALAAIDKLHLRVKELETEMKELKAEIRALKQGK